MTRDEHINMKWLVIPPGILSDGLSSKRWSENILAWEQLSEIGPSGFLSSESKYHRIRILIYQYPHCCVYINHTRS